MPAGIGYPGDAPGGGAGSPLDGPPPSPPLEQPGGTQFTMQSLVPQVPTDQMPPELLTGILESANTVASIVDSWAQATPDQAAQLALIKELLQQYLRDITVAGAGATSPTEPGAAFPGGGIDRGIAGSGAI